MNIPMRAAIAWLWVPGWVLAALLNYTPKHPFVSFQLRQALGWLLLCLILFAVIRFRLLAIGFYLLGAVYGLVNALNEEQTELPVVGGYFDKWFKSVV